MGKRNREQVRELGKGSGNPTQLPPDSRPVPPALLLNMIQGMRPRRTVPLSDHADQVLVD